VNAWRKSSLWGKVVQNDWSKEKGERCCLESQKKGARAEKGRQGKGEKELSGEKRPGSKK